ncbi:kinase-like protein [Ceratobasidium sp. AG-I]|nr:kinase-like protein [Ceratobasidium sp. AG-I]
MCSIYLRFVCLTSIQSLISCGSVVPLLHFSSLVSFLLTLFCFLYSFSCNLKHKLGRSQSDLQAPPVGLRPFTQQRERTSSLHQPIPIRGANHLPSRVPPLFPGRAVSELSLPVIMWATESSQPDSEGNPAQKRNGPPISATIPQLVVEGLSYKLMGIDTHETTTKNRLTGMPRPTITPPRRHKKNVHPYRVQSAKSVGLSKMDPERPTRRIVRESKDSGLTSVRVHPTFKITSKTPLGDVVTYFKRNANLRDFTTELKNAICSDYPVANGGLADVYTATLGDGSVVAIKRMRSTCVVEGKATKRTAQELHTWSKIQHRNILKLLGLAVFGDKLAMISPWMKNGNVMQYMKNNPSLNKYALCAQVVDVVSYLHGIDVVHGDLKGDNILVSDDGILKLTDFGLAIMHEQATQFSTTEMGGGTYRWMAPELMKDDGVRSKEADVYALGMVR